MKIGPPARSKADYEGLYLVEIVDDDGLTRGSWMSEDELAEERRPNCGKCCHAPSGVVIIGQVKDGKLGDQPVEELVRVKESGW